MKLRRGLLCISSLCVCVSVQGHYRYAEALFYMGELQRAIEANDAAIDMCGDDDKMVLHEQRAKFIEEATKPNSMFSTRPPRREWWYCCINKLSNVNPA